jgi:hypothetical protein
MLFQKDIDVPAVNIRYGCKDSTFEAGTYV